MDLKMITTPYFTMLVLMTIGVTSIVTPLISMVYDPTRPYMINTRRNIQHTASNIELHIIACIHNEENVPGIINILFGVSNPTAHTNFIVHALHLMELVGRAAPIFIDHQDSENLDQNLIHNALKLFSGENIKIHSYTSYSPKKSMYQDICKLPLEKKASLIILPFYKGTQVLTRLQNDRFFDLWILGRNQGINPVLLRGLTNWSAQNELGVIGDFLVSMNSGTMASILVMQQQILKDQETTSLGFLQNIATCR